MREFEGIFEGRRGRVGSQQERWVSGRVAGFTREVGRLENVVLLIGQRERIRYGEQSWIVQGVFQLGGVCCFLFCDDSMYFYLFFYFEELVLGLLVVEYISCIQGLQILQVLEFCCKFFILYNCVFVVCFFFMKYSKF